ncbi:MAG: RDD family protein [Maritimibacter sp.]
MTYSNAQFGLPDPVTQSEFYADIPMKRLFAWVIDVIIVFTISFFISVFTLGLLFLLFGFLSLAIGFIYRTVTLANGSATLGMRMMGIEIRRASGERLDLASAALHTIGYQLSMAFILVQIGSIVLMLTSARAQGLSDHILGTAAINRPARF